MLFIDKGNYWIRKKGLSCILTKSFFFFQFFPFFLMSILPVTVSKQFSQSFTTPKWVLIYVCGVLSLIQIFIKGKFYLPQFSPRQKILASLLITSLLLNFFREGFDLYSTSTLNRLSFWLLVCHGVSVFSSFKKAEDSCRLIIYLLVFPVFLVITGALCQILGYFFDLINLDVNFLRVSTFGNKNILAEFLGFSLVLFLAFIDSNDLKLKYSLKVLSAALMVYLYFLECRSVFLALLVTCAFLLIRKRLKFRTLQEILCYAAVLFALLHLPKPGFTTINNVSQIKSEFPWLLSTITDPTGRSFSLFERINFWKASWEMIQDHPWGIGSDRFDYAFLPYKMQFMSLREMAIEKSPHNEYLRFLSEEGLWVCFLGCILIMSLFYQGGRAAQANKNHAAWDFFLCFVIFYAIQALFQFPLENPFPFLLGSLMTAFFFVHLYPSLSIIKLKRAFLIAPLVLYSTFAGAISLAHYYVGTAPSDLEKMKMATWLDPSNWHAALYSMENTFLRREYEETLRQAINELTKRPYNFPALYWKGSSEYSLGLISQACGTFSLYDDLFEGNSRHHAYFEEICKSH
jgi:O-antigen ligase